MLEKISIKEMNTDQRVMLLKELGYDSDGTFIYNKKGEQVIDPYINQPVRLNNMVILPGSVVILDNNPLSIVSYLEDHPNVRL